MPSPLRMDFGVLLIASGMFDGKYYEALNLLLPEEFVGRSEGLMMEGHLESKSQLLNLPTESAVHCTMPLARCASMSPWRPSAYRLRHRSMGCSPRVMAPQHVKGQPHETVGSRSKTRSDCQGCLWRIQPENNASKETPDRLSQEARSAFPTHEFDRYTLSVGKL